MASKVSREKGYVGETRTQLRHGYGIYKYPNQFFRYEGEWKEGKKHGHGKLVMTDGSYYEGEFINGEIEGHGFRKWATTGNTYSGQFCNGELNGFGIMTYGTGAVYEGEFQSNKREGRGVMKFADGSIYEGLFHNNVRHGEGSQTFVNGDCYVGDWVQDKRQGSGELKFHDGSVYDGQWRNDYYNGSGTLIHSSGMTYDGMWINGRPAELMDGGGSASAITHQILFSYYLQTSTEGYYFIANQLYRKSQVEAARIVITTDECQELPQDAAFTITIEIQSEEGELVTDEQGRELNISAGFKHQVPNQGSPLLDLIEDMEEEPIPTPYYDVVSYPITEYSFMEERLKALDESGLMKPPGTAFSDATSVNPSAAPSVIEDTTESLGETEERETELPAVSDVKPVEADVVVEQEKVDPVKHVLEIQPEISNVEDEEEDEESRGQKDEKEMSESPTPPPVSRKRTQSGKVQFEALILPGVPHTGETPLPNSPLSNTPLPTSAKSTKSKVRGGKSRGTKGVQDELPIQPPEQVNFEKIKDPKIAKAKREKLYGDERFARPGEYIVIVSDVTSPPFLGQQLPPAFCRIKVQHPKKLKKVKTPTKSKPGSKAPE